MKRPKPRDYGLDSDHAPLSYISMSTPADPAQPYTQDELTSALNRLILAEALAARQSAYSRALAEWEYNNGGR